MAAPNVCYELQQIRAEYRAVMKTGIATVPMWEVAPTTNLHNQAAKAFIGKGFKATLTQSHHSMAKCNIEGMTRYV